jgi:hypothetical protein
MGRRESVRWFVRLGCGPASKSLPAPKAQDQNWARIARKNDRLLRFEVAPGKVAGITDVVKTVVLGRIGT